MVFRSTVAQTVVLNQLQVKIEWSQFRQRLECYLNIIRLVWNYKPFKLLWNVVSHFSNMMNQYQYTVNDLYDSSPLCVPVAAPLDRSSWNYTKKRTL